MIDAQETSTRGAFVVVVGPDGSGKTTFARALIAATTRPTAYFHFRPPLRGPLRAEPPDVAALPVTKTPTRGRADLVRGWIRLLRTAAHCSLAYWLRIRPAIRRGALVIGDRWIFGYLTQPEPLRYYGPASLAHLIVRLVPKPSLTVNLTAPVPVLLARKRELTREQLADELEVTRHLPVAGLVTLSSEQPPNALAAQVFEYLEAVEQPSGDTLATQGGMRHRHDQR